MTLKILSRLAVVLALATVSCDRTPSAPEVRPPETTQNGLVPPPGTVLHVLHDQLPLFAILNTSATVGPAGGTITLLGHKLMIPPNAVMNPTLFTMVQLPTGNIELELDATVTDLLGHVFNVGSGGFNRPVKLTLTYARTPDDLTRKRLWVVHVNGSTLEPLQSRIDKVNKTVTATLPHFSKYALASN